MTEPSTRVCPVCSAVQEQSLMCHTCTTRLERELGDVAAIVADLDVTISKQARLGASGGKGAPARERTPVNWGAVAVADDLRNTLTTWARDIDGFVWRYGFGGPIQGAAVHLLASIDAIRRHPAVNELVDEIHDAIAQARRAVDRPLDRVFVGPCMVATPNEDGQDVTCLSDIYARPAASSATCKVCGVTHDVAERRAWLLQQAADRLFTVREAAQMVGDVGGIRVTEDRIRGYLRRGRLVFHTGNVIRLGDLLTIVINDGEKKTA